MTPQQARTQAIAEALNHDRGTAFDPNKSDAVFALEGRAIARAISDAYGTNQRVANLWQPMRCSMDMLARWETILALAPAPTATDYERRVVVAKLFARFGQAATGARVTALLTLELGDAFVSVDHFTLPYATIYVPDGSYPGGVVNSASPWSSSVSKLLVRMRQPVGWSDTDFYNAVGKLYTVLDPILPVYVTIDWYREGSPPISIPQGPTGAGFYLDQTHNLNEQRFAT